MRGPGNARSSTPRQPRSRRAGHASLPGSAGLSGVFDRAALLEASGLFDLRDLLDSAAEDDVLELRPEPAPASRSPLAWLLAAVLTLVLAVGLALAPVEADRLRGWFFEGATWGFWLAAVLVGWSVWEASEDGALALAPRRAAWALALPLGLTVLLFSAVGTEYRVLADETNNLATSHAMFRDRRAALPIEGEFLDERFYTLAERVPVKPCFYPFLVHLVHHLRGYDPRHGFVVNFLVAVCTLLVVGALGRRVAGPRGGWVAPVLLAATPLFALQVTSANYDALNLLVLMLAGLLTWRWLEAPNRRDAEWLLVTLALGAHVRHETALLLGPVALALLWRGRALLADLPHARVFLLAPLVPLLVWQRRLTTVVNPGNPTEAVFHPDHLWANLGHAWTFLRDPDGIFPVVQALPALALLGAGVLLLRALPGRRHRPSSSVGVAMALVVAASLGGLALVQFSYYLCDLRQGFIARVALTYMGWVALLATAAVAALLRRPGLRPLVVGGLVVLLAQGLSVASKDLQGGSLFLFREYKRNLEILSKLDRRDVVVVTDRSCMYLAAGYSSIAPGRLVDRPAQLAWYRRGEVYDKLVLIERVGVGTSPAAPAGLDEALPLLEQDRYPLTRDLGLRLRVYDLRAREELPPAFDRP